MARSALIAVGGNSLIRAGEKGVISEQLANARRTAAAVVGLLDDEWRIVLTHGNGPQVGAALLRSERASDQVYGQPLDVCDAATQGEIGYLLQQSLCNELGAAGKQMHVATILTQVVVSPDDPAMKNPTKPVGPFYSREDAEEKARLLGWQIVEDAARGYRRVVPSPEPIAVVEEDVIRKLLAQGVLLIAAGGGGIPVVREGERLRGIEAVIDKDRVAALLALRLGVDLFVISTDADAVYLDYKKPTQRRLDRVTCDELEQHHRDRQFPPGNMGPKVESAIRFLRGGGREVIITCYEQLLDAVRGTAGTHVVAEQGK
ncbi:MAG: carbamate kinase [Deltaproteobacteria bacterium]|nr:carbamate kinase [Deltaproteobacteria bacterium]